MSSCTDLPLPWSSSLKQSFPSLGLSPASSNRLSRASSLKDSKARDPDVTLKRNKRAKVAFLNICDSLTCRVTGNVAENENENSGARTNVAGSYHVIMNSKMSKEEFIHKLEAGMHHAAPDSPDDPAYDHKYAKSDSVLTGKESPAVRTQNISKSTTAIQNIRNNGRNDSGSEGRVSIASKAIFTGFFILIFFGFVKSVTSK